MSDLSTLLTSLYLDVIMCTMGQTRGISITADHLLGVNSLTCFKQFDVYSHCYFTEHRDRSTAGSDLQDQIFL